MDQPANNGDDRFVESQPSAFVFIKKKAKLDKPQQMSDGVRAPKGYTKAKPLVIGDKEFVGGEWIPEEYLDKMGPVQKMMLKAESGQEDVMNKIKEQKDAENTSKAEKIKANALPDDLPRTDDLWPQENDLPDWMTDWIKKSGDFGQRCVAAYTGLGYGEVNGPLHEVKSEINKDVAEKYNLNKLTLGLHQTIAEAPPLPKPVTVWRGINMQNKEDHDKLVENIKTAARTGAIFRMTGFLSCSLKPSIAANFTSNNEDSGLVFEIRTQHGVYTNGMSEHQDEREFIMDHASAFKIAGVKKVAVQSSVGSGTGTVQRTVVQLEEVDTKGAAKETYFSRS